MSDAHRILLSLFALLILMIAAPHASAEDTAEHASAPTADATPPVETKLDIGKTDSVIHVGDLHCKSCAKKIARKLYAVKGVVKVRADVKADVVIVTPQTKKTIEVNALWTAAQKAGFPPVKLVGPTGTFEPDPKTKAPVRVAEQVANKPK